MKLKTYIISLVLCAAGIFTATAAEPYAVQVKTLGSLAADGIAATGSGRVWVAMQAGGANADGCIVLSYLDNKGKKWSIPVAVVTAEEGSSVGNAVLWTSPEDGLWLFYSVSKGRFDGRAGIRAMVCNNPDDAAPSWSEPTEVGAGICSGKPVVLGNGRWAVPMALWGRTAIDAEYTGEHGELDEQRGAGIYFTRDNGKTWTSKLGLHVPEKVKSGYNNPQLLVRKDGAMLMSVRSCGTAWNYALVSKDFGRSWSSPMKYMPHSDAKMSLTRLADGKLLMVRNGRMDQTVYSLGEGIYAYLSEDDGATWYGGICIDSRMEAATPEVAQTPDGRIHVIYSCDPLRKGEVMLATLTDAEIDASTADPMMTAASVKCIFKAGKAEANATAELKRLNAPKKNWGKQTVRIGTYNIQYRTSNWKSTRLPALRNQWALFDFDIVGTQEPYMSQINDMMEFLGDEYAWVGEMSISGKHPSSNSHYGPIFYRKERFEVVDWDVIWYTEKPGTPGYGGYSSRMCIWARFHDKANNNDFYVFNSHFDHLGIEARVKAAYILRDAVARIANGMPALMTGDFNSDETTLQYRVLTESGFIDDTMLAISEPTNADYFSMARYKVSGLKKTKKHIDHIFYTFANVQVMDWKLFIEDYEGTYGSDHLPIVAECKIAN